MTRNSFRNPRKENVYAINKQLQLWCIKEMMSWKKKRRRSFEICKSIKISSLRDGVMKNSWGRSGSMRPSVGFWHRSPYLISLYGGHLRRGTRAPWSYFNNYFLPSNRELMLSSGWNLFIDHFGICHFS